MMTRIAYFDCFHGAAGDMLLAALLDAGLGLADLEVALAALPLDGYRLVHVPAISNGIRGSRLRVEVLTAQSTRDWNTIRAMLTAGDLPPRVRIRALGAFGRLARVEAAIHGVPEDRVHFHEVGAVDSIVDTVGFCMGLELLGIEQVFASPLPTGQGWVRTQHGPLPVPAPATLALLAEIGAPIIPGPEDSKGELLTPTAAALLAELAGFRQPAMKIERVGYGMGWKEFSRLNGLRVWIGERSEPWQSSGAGPEHTHAHHNLSHHDHAEPQPADASPSRESLVELRCNLDDASGELIAYVIERLLAAGALDAWAAPLVMKKGRPAVQLACLARSVDVEPLADLFLRETPSLGLRWSAVERLAAGRDLVEATTQWGTVRVKRKLLEGRVAGVAPEYEDCAAIARSHDVPLAQVYAEALRAVG